MQIVKLEFNTKMPVALLIILVLAVLGILKCYDHASPKNLNKNNKCWFILLLCQILFLFQWEKSRSSVTKISSKPLKEMKRDSCKSLVPNALHCISFAASGITLAL